MLLRSSRILLRSSSLKNSISIVPVLSAFEFKCTLVPKMAISSFSRLRTDLFLVDLIVFFTDLTFALPCDIFSAALTDRSFLIIIFKRLNIAGFVLHANIARACPADILFCFKYLRASDGNCNNRNEFAIVDLLFPTELAMLACDRLNSFCKTAYASDSSMGLRLSL